MISLIQFFSSSVLLKQEKTEQEVPDKKTINKEYWKVAFPAAIEGVLLNLMLLADLIMVGMLGIEKAAAVGIVSQPKMILQMILLIFLIFWKSTISLTKTKEVVN